MSRLGDVQYWYIGRKSTLKPAIHVLHCSSVQSWHVSRQFQHPVYDFQGWTATTLNILESNSPLGRMSKCLGRYGWESKSFYIYCTHANYVCVCVYVCVRALVCVCVCMLMWYPAGWLYDISGSYALPVAVGGGIIVLSGLCELYLFARVQRQKRNTSKNTIVFSGPAPVAAESSAVADTMMYISVLPNEVSL